MNCDNIKLKEIKFPHKWAGCLGVGNTLYITNRDCSTDCFLFDGRNTQLKYFTYDSIKCCIEESLT